MSEGYERRRAPRQPVSCRGCGWSAARSPGARRQPCPKCHAPADQVVLVKPRRCKCGRRTFGTICNVCSRGGRGGRGGGDLMSLCLATEHGDPALATLRCEALTRQVQRVQRDYFEEV